MHRSFFYQSIYFFFFFFNDTATTEIYTLSLHDALPILQEQRTVGDLDSHLGARREADDHGLGPLARRHEVAARHQQGERQGDEDANPSRLSLLHRCTTTGYTRDLIVQLDRREPPPATTGEAQR